MVFVFDMIYLFFHIKYAGGDEGLVHSRPHNSPKNFFLNIFKFYFNFPSNPTS